MARLFISGLETGDKNEDWNGGYGTGANSVQAGIVRTGGYSWRVNPTADSYWMWKTLASQTVYIRFYIRIASAPSSLASIYVAEQNVTYMDVARIRLDTDRTLVCDRYDGAAYQNVGVSDSLDLNSWHRVEIKIIAADSGGEITVKLDGVQFGTYSGDTKPDANTMGDHNFGVTTSCTTDVYFDDVSIDDSDWCGAGQIIARQPVVGAPTYNNWDKTGADPYWAQTPYETNNYADGDGAQTKLISDFNNPQDGHGSETIDSDDTINTCKIIIAAKRGGGPSTIHSIRRRLNSADTDTQVSLSTSIAFFDDGFWTDTLANLNGMEAGGLNDDGRDMYIYDLWVMVDYTLVTPPAGPVNVKKVSGVVKVSIKKVSGVVLASVKKIVGVS